jgi:two-component system, cell cycle sensor histidine kinase and response regulator CckA
MASLINKWTWFLILTIAILGIIFSSWIAVRSDRQLREDLSIHVQIIADSIDQHDIKALSFNLGDRANPAFVRVEDWMKKIARVVGCRSLYSVVKRGDGILFGPENLQEKDQFASPPGTLYKTPPEKLGAVFQNRKAITVGPYTDEYGTFVSAFAPVISRDSGEVLLVIGMDVEAADWKRNVASDAALPVTLTIFLVFMLMVFVHLQNTRVALKAGEVSLHESENKYQFLFETMAQGVMYLASDGRMINANPAAQRILGLTLDQTEKSNSFDDRWKAVHEDGSHYPEETYPAMVALQTGKPVFHSVMGVIKPHDDNYLWIDMDAIPQFRPGEVKPYQVYATFVDITVRKQAEEALREKNAKMESIFRAAPVGIGVVINRILVEVNQRICEMTGYSHEEMVGKSASILYPTREEFDFVGSEKYRQIQLQGTGSVETLWRRKDGTIINVIVSSAPIDTEDLLAGVTFTALDVTERKRSEEQAKNLETQLFQAQKMESIGTLAGGIAHDFNNLLTGILGNASLILAQIDRSQPFYDRLKNIEDYVKRGSDLTKQLLGFARRGKYETKPTNLAEFIRESSELFRRTKKEISIHLKAQEELWVVEVDRGQMEQVLLNLYVNAWHAMPGGGDLYISAENVSLAEVDVDPYDANPGSYVKITVSDTGIGMDEATMARIFDPFFTTKEKGRGTGLGLASAYGIIKNHGGFIHVESEKGHGTSFMIYIPASDKLVENDDHRCEEELQTGHETVLLIDDEDMIRDVGSNILEGLGYRVMTATGGKEGVKVYEQNRAAIDIVIIDMIMPEIGGRETFDTMLKINPSVKVLLSSGYSLDGQAEEILRRGCKGFIQKPFTTVELSKKIRRILDDR